MSRRDLAAAGIADPLLQASYERCRRLNAAHGKTYYLATLLLPPAKRPYVHALYGFARYADEIVDDLDSTLSDEQKAQWLDDWSTRFLKGERDADGQDVLPAVHDTIARWDLPLAHFEAFLDSMRMDLQVTQYQTFEDLMGYIYGSAAVIGLQMVPVLEPLPGMAEPAAFYARDLGVAFQLANFIRDVGEDLRRGRIYLPQEDLAEFDVTQASTSSTVSSMAGSGGCSRTRSPVPGRSSAPRPPAYGCCTRPAGTASRTATRLYAGILDEVEKADYRVLDRRVAGRAAASAQRRRARSRAGPCRPSHTHQARVCVTSAKPNSRSSTGA